MAARQLRLKRATAMLNTIGKAGIHGSPAKMEIRLARMANRPAAYTVIQIKQAGFFGNLRAGLGRNQAARRSRGDRCLLIAGALAHKAAGANRNDARLWLGCGPWHWLAGDGRIR